MLKPPADQPLDNPGVIAFPPLIWLVNAVISVLVHLFVRLPIMSYRNCLACGIVFIILAPTLALSAFRTMKAAETNVHPSEPSLTIVRGGPFRFTRNPMYLALCLLQVALGFFLNDWITLLFVVPLILIFHYGVVLREESDGVSQRRPTFSAADSPITLEIDLSARW